VTSDTAKLMRKALKSPEDLNKGMKFWACDYKEHYRWYTCITHAAILWSLCFGSLQNNITIYVSGLDRSPSSYKSARAHVLTLTWYANTHRFRIILPIGPRCIGISFSVLTMNYYQFCPCKVLYVWCCSFILNGNYGWKPNREW
jgi:hypothetical protein